MKSKRFTGIRKAVLMERLQHEKEKARSELYELLEECRLFGVRHRTEGDLLRPGNFGRQARQANLRFCSRWVALWRKAPAVVERAGIIDAISALQWEDEKQMEVHALFVEILKGHDPEAVSSELAELREVCLGDPPTLQPTLAVGFGTEYPTIPVWDHLARYFEKMQDWLRSDPTARSSVEDRSGAPELPLLPEQACTFRGILLRQRPEEPLLGSKLCDLYQQQTGESVDDADFRKRIVPPLKRWGLKNKPRVGYYFPPDAVARRNG